MEVVELAIPDVKLIKPRRFDDDRGFFQQTYHFEQYAAAGGQAPPVVVRAWRNW